MADVARSGAARVNMDFTNFGVNTVGTGAVSSRPTVRSNMCENGLIHLMCDFGGSVMNRSDINNNQKLVKSQNLDILYLFTAFPFFSPRGCALRCNQR